MSTYFVRDHKVGFKLAKKSAKALINYVSDIKLLTFYSFYKDSIEKDIKNKYVIFVRHPKEIIVSGYLYHKVCKEKWAKEPSINYYDEYLNIFSKKSIEKNTSLIIKSQNFTKIKSYQQIVKEKPQEEGLSYELNNVGYLTLTGLNEILDIDKPNVHFIDMDNYTFYFDETFNRLFKFLEIDEQKYEQVKFKLAQKTHLILFKDRNYHKSIKHITNKELKQNRYKDYWTQNLEQEFNHLFPNLMNKYESKLI